MYTRGVYTFRQIPRSTAQIHGGSNFRSGGKCTLFVHLSQKYPYAGVHFTRLPSRSTYYLKGFANVPVVSLAVDDMDDD